MVTDLDGTVEASLVIHDDTHAAAADAELVGPKTRSFRNGIATLANMYISRTGSDFELLIHGSPRTMMGSASVGGINVLSRQFNPSVVAIGRVVSDENFMLTSALMDVSTGIVAGDLDWRVSL